MNGRIHPVLISILVLAFILVSSIAIIYKYDVSIGRCISGKVRYEQSL